MVQTKCDGMRVNIKIKGGAVEGYYSRTGKKLNLPQLDRHFQVQGISGDWVLDGELLVLKDGAVMPRQIGNGILRKASKGAIPDDVQAVLWDAIPYEHFTEGYSPLEYSERWDTLTNLIEETENVKLVDCQWCSNAREVLDVYHQKLSGGLEGVIVKAPNGFWEAKKVQHQAKLKAELEADLKVVAVCGGSGKFEGQLGALICESADGKVRVSVGVGFSSQERIDLFSQDLIGKIVAVRYNSVTANAADCRKSLFLPVFIEVRDDKDHADMAEDL
jgi:ATP-dependent DNA ligase